jgi:RimJ/RimL family protein N-acetyltransferase
MNVENKTYKLKNGATVTIRTATEHDAEAYLSLGKSIMAEQIYSLTQPEELNLTIEQEREWLRSKFEDDCHLVICAEVNGQIVGQLDFSNGHRKRNAHTGEFGMGIHKDFRGLGIGSLLIGALVDWAKNNPKIEKINLCVHQNNDRAIATYKKFGFQVEGLRTKDLKYSNDVYVDSLLMGLHV